MFTSTLFTAVLASTVVLVSRADVIPNSPGPGDSFTVGGQCTIGWAADPSGTDIWKGMSIELMTGSNEKMVHLTTVATGQDGSVAGTFSYTCPDVSPKSQIYFYQFTSCTAPNTTWTGRFTIAGADGQTAAPTQSELFDGTTTVFFGTATLATPAAASAAPVCNNAGAGSAGSAAAGGVSNSVSVSASAGGAAAYPSPSLSNGGFSSQKLVASTPAPTPSSARSSPSSASGAAQASGSSAALAVGPLAVDTRMWPIVTALSAAALAFTILL